MLVWKSELLIIVIWSIFCRLFWVKSYYKEPVWYAGHAIDIYESQKWIQWNLFKPNFQGTIFCVLNKQMFGLCRVKPNWRRFPTLRLYLKFVLCGVGFGQFSLYLITCTMIKLKRYLYCIRMEITVLYFKLRGQKAWVYRR